MRGLVILALLMLMKNESDVNQITHTQLPEKHIIREQFCNAGLENLANNTNVIEKLAGNRLSTQELVDVINAGYSDYKTALTQHCSDENQRKINQIKYTVDQTKKIVLVKSILSNNPEVFEEAKLLLTIKQKSWSKK